jgi:glycerol-3-phosphate cytidylyltransferase
LWTILKIDCLKMKDKIVGYTSGVFDLFHIGHLNILKKSREHCDYLIVGVSTDELVQEYKNKKTIIPFEERKEIIESIKYVDKVVPQVTMNKKKAQKLYKYNKIFVGDDWKNTEKWNQIEKDFNKVGVEVVYFPYTKRTSSTKINEILDDILLKNK